jgi:hypothetical protein
VSIFVSLFPSLLCLRFRFHFWIASLSHEAFHLVFCLHRHHLTLWFLFFISIVGCDYTLVFIKLRNQSLRVFVFFSIYVVVSIKLSSCSGVCVDIQFVSTAMCSCLHLHHIQLVFGCSSPSPLHSSEKFLICVWIMLFVFNTLLFAFVVSFVFCRSMLFKHPATSSRSRAILVLMKSRPQPQPPDSHANMVAATVATR